MYLDPDDLKWMVDQGMTDEQIAKKVHYSEGSIKQYRCKLGIHRPPRGGPPPCISNERLEELSKTMTDTEIANMIRVHPATIKSLRSRRSITKRPPMSRPPKKELETMLKQLWTQNQIAKKYGVCLSTVQNWERFYGLKHPMDNSKRACREYARRQSRLEAMGRVKRAV